MNRLRYFARRVKHWKRKLLVDPKIDIDVLRRETEGAGDASAMLPESQKHEELLVTHLERILIGEDQWDRVRKVCSGGKGALATLDADHAEYWKYSIWAHPRMLDIACDKDFRLVADSVACHEVLHVIMWPAFSHYRGIDPGVT